MLGDVDPEQLLAQILEAMLVGVSAGQLGGDLGAIDRRADNAQVMLKDREIEPREVKDLGHRRVAEKGAGVVTETLLVIDATTGQNGLVQAREFGEATAVTGVVVTKLDGSAKGGIVFAVETELGIPVKLVGVGEGVDDLVPFDPAEFVDALVGD